MKIEIELMNGDRILLADDFSKIYSLKEKSRTYIELTKKFPFFKISKKRFTQFRFRTVYSTFDSFFDPKYKVNCSLVSLAKLFGVDVKQFELNVVENELRSI